MEKFERGQIVVCLASPLTKKLAGMPGIITDCLDVVNGETYYQVKLVSCFSPLEFESYALGSHLLISGEEKREYFAKRMNIPAGVMVAIDDFVITNDPSSKSIPMRWVSRNDNGSYELAGIDGSEMSVSPFYLKIGVAEEKVEPLSLEEKRDILLTTVDRLFSDHLHDQIAQKIKTYVVNKTISEAVPLFKPGDIVQYLGKGRMHTDADGVHAVVSLVYPNGKYYNIRLMSLLHHVSGQLSMVPESHLIKIQDSSSLQLFAGEYVRVSTVRFPEANGKIGRICKVAMIPANKYEVEIDSPEYKAVIMCYPYELSLLPTIGCKIKASYPQAYSITGTVVKYDASRDTYTYIYPGENGPNYATVIGAYVTLLFNEEGDDNVQDK